MHEKQKSFYSSREAADLLGVAVSTVQLWTNNGSLSAWVTDGGHRRITRKSVDQILKRQHDVSNRVIKKKHLSVVVVEDNEQQLRLYKKQLLSWPVDIDLVTAKDGYEGLVKIGNIIPDIIITDLKMPNMNGFQMVRALQVMPELQGSLIIVITGLREDEVQEEGGLPESVYLFTKPVSFTKLQELMCQRLEVESM